MRAAVGCASKAWNGSTSAADGTRPRGRQPRGGGRTQAGLSGIGTGRHATRRGRFRSTRCPLPDVERHGGGPLGGRVSPRGRKSPENVAPRGELHVHARLNGAPAASYQWIENMRPAAPPQERAACWKREGTSSAVSPSPECEGPARRRNGRPSPIVRSRAFRTGRRASSPGAVDDARHAPSARRTAGTVLKPGTAQYARIPFKCVWRRRTRRP